MKKLITLLFAIVLFTGCIPVPTETKPTDTEPEPETAIEPETNIEGEVQTLAITEEEDTYTINVQYPQLDGFNELNERLKTMALTEVNAFKDQMADLSGSYLEANYEIYRNDANIFSVAYEYYVYISGAAHPYTYTTTLNWNENGGKKIEWVDVISGDQDIPLILSEMVKPKLYEMLEADENVVDDWIEEGAGPNAANFDNFTITSESIVIYFDPYEVAAYAAGPQKVEIPFEDLGVLLNPQFGA